jgi:hypothetical protein
MGSQHSELTRRLSLDVSPYRIFSSMGFDTVATLKKIESGRPGKTGVVVQG